MGIEEESCPRCNKCDRWRTAPEYMQDPWLLWERFPCPPPGTDRARLLLELDWTGHMGSKDGCRALERVSTRCKLDLTQVGVIPRSLVNCDNLFKRLVICGTQCVVAIILACICFLFVILLAIVCYRYVRRNSRKKSNPPCPKLPARDQTSGFPINLRCVQSQYYYRAGHIPEMRYLPVEMRSSENDIEERLIRALQAPPRPNYPFEEICSQCINGSKQTIVADPWVRQGYERIYWKDKNYIQKRVPPNYSLHRNHANRHKYTAGSSSDVSHNYEYIGDSVYDSSTGRRSNHSMINHHRNSSTELKEQSVRDLYCSDWKIGHRIYPRLPITDLDFRGPSHQEIVPSRSSLNMRLVSIHDQNIYQRSLSDHYNYLDNTLEHKTTNSLLGSNEILTRHRHPAESSQAEGGQRELMKGYKYTMNPYFDEETTTVSVPESYDLSTSPETPSECIEFDELASNQIGLHSGETT